MPRSPFLLSILLVTTAGTAIAAPDAGTRSPPDAAAMAPEPAPAPAIGYPVADDVEDPVPSSADMAPGGGGDCITRCNNWAEACRKAGNSETTCAGAYNACMLQCNQSSTLVGTTPGATPSMDSGIATSPKEQDLVASAYDAIIHGNWWMLAGVALMLVTLVARRGLTLWHAGFDRDRVGVVMVTGIGVAGGIAHSLMAGHTPDAETWRAVVETVMAAITVYVVPKKILKPS